MYNHIYYWINKLFLSFDGFPNFWTIIVLYWLLLTNSSTLLFALLEGNYDCALLNYESFMLYAILMLIGHFIYYSHKRRTDLINKLDKMTRNAKVFSLTTAIIYVKATILIFVYYTVPYIEKSNAGVGSFGGT